MKSPYENCPLYENENYLLRFVEETDAPDLLLVYSDEKAVPFFNSDNCNGDDFHYTSLERMQEAVKYWQWEYSRKGFVRWSVIDKGIHQAVGTIEIFNRCSKDYFNNCGLLRLDLRSDYEQAEHIFDILSLIVRPTFDLFDCQMVASKVPPLASERETAMKRIGFVPSDEILVGGHDNQSYNGYYVLKKEQSN